MVITAASERHLTACEALGLRALRIGEEAVVDPASVQPRGPEDPEGAPVGLARAAPRLAGRGGRGTRRSLRARRELAHVETDWRSRQRRLIGFAMTLGRLAGPGDRGGGIYVLGRDPEGRLRSFLRFAPYRDGLSLDLMRRAANEPNGLTEALVVAAIEHARERGPGSVSLNFAGFAHVMAADAALSRSQRLLRLGLRLFHGRFQLERLVRFNAKFFPTWQPRYLVYDGLTHLPLSALRVLQAEAYLPAPEPGRRREPPRRPPGSGSATAATAVCAADPSTLLVDAGDRAPAASTRGSDHSDWSFVYSGPGV